MRGLPVFRRYATGARAIAALILFILCGQALAAGADRVLVVGSEQDYPPFAIGKTDGDASGFTVELWKAVAAESKLDYRIRVLPFRQILQEFREGRIDVLINLAQSDERRQFAAFTVPHVTIHGAVFVRKGTTGIDAEADLAEKSIIVLNSDLAHDYAVSKGWKKNLVLVDTAAQGFQLLAAGKHDALLLGKLAGMQTLQQLKLPNVKALNVQVGFSQKFSFAAHKEDDALLARMNEGLALVKSSGAYDALYEKWFGVYEKKDSHQDLLTYLLVAAVALAGVAGYFFRQRQAERQQAERALRASEQRWSLALQCTGDGVWDWNTQTGEVVYSPRWKGMLGYAEGDVVNRFETWEKLVHPADRERALAAVSEYFEGKTATYNNEHRMRCKDGSWKWVLSRGMVVSRDADGKPLRMIGTYTDLGERKRMEEELKLAAMVYQALGEAIMAADADNRIIAVNPAFTRLTGYTAQEAIGQSTKLLSSGRQEPAFYQRLWHGLETTGHWSGEVWNRRKNGEEYLEWMSINTIYDDQGGVLQRVAMFSDITDKKRAEETIWLQANYDPLTDLPNRRLFQDRLQQEIRKSQRAGLPIAILFIDLDRFKEVNDTLGHSMGDILLQDAARRLRSCVRETDTVARLGGDEFTVILSELCDRDNVERISQDILRKLSEPFQLLHEVAYISASIGITIYPDDATEIEDLLKNADQAMYAAKNQGRNRCHYFTPSMQAVAQNRMRLAGDLRGALADDQFRLVYQPVLDLATGAIHKAEALIRWQHPKRGLVNPAEFIPIAEDTGMIIDIGNWVFREAARQAAHWRATHCEQFQISVNMSPVQFHSEDNGVATWFDYLRKLGLPGQGIVVEITEGLLLDASAAVSSRLLAFRDAGIQVALDDFGTGYSSLSYLKKFDIDYLKIDQSFVRNLAPDSSDTALCEAIIAMAHKLDLKVIAEGVETEQQRALLAAAGCDYGQGFLFSRPVSALEFESLLRGEETIS